jgi:glyoxalase family protein
MEHRIRGLHHVTATVAGAQEDLDFYTRLLGLRLVKRTVNFDNHGVYHFYYGDGRGTPGTIWTTFPYAGQGVRVGEKGTGQVTATAFAVPAGALGFWAERLAAHGVAAREAPPRFGAAVLAFEDPSGLRLELVAGEGGAGAPWGADGIGAGEAIRGLHGVTLEEREVEPTRRLLEDVLGLAALGEEGGRTRFGTAGGTPALDVLHRPDGAPGVNGLGTVHHVALAIGTDEEQLTLREQVLGLGYSVTEVRDRNYFRSIYFREPGGVLVEVATLGPGFLVDEDEGALGQALKLPAWEEPNRAAIEAALPVLRA